MVFNTMKKEKPQFRYTTLVFKGHSRLSSHLIPFNRRVKQAVTSMFILPLKKLKASKVEFSKMQ